MFGRSWSNICAEKIERFVNIYDIPDKKLKLHKKKTPVLGGLILLINFSIYFCFQIYLFDQFILTEYSNFNIRDIFSILILFLSLFFIGLYDDKYKLNPNNKPNSNPNIIVNNNMYTSNNSTIDPKINCD